MAEKRDIILVKSAGSGAGGEHLFWLFSKNQLEMVLRDIVTESVPAQPSLTQGVVNWQDQALPLVNLESYYGTAGRAAEQPTRYLFIKGAARTADEVQLAMIVVPIYAEMRMGALDIAGKPISPLPLKANSTDIHGIYALDGGGVAVVPDVWRIASRCREEGQDGTRR